MSETAGSADSNTTPPSESPRDLQRKSLDDLMRLATESAATERAIEQRFADEVEAAEKGSKNTYWEIDQQAAKLREQIAQKHQERLEQIDANHQAELQKVKQAHEAARRRIDHDHATVERDVKEKFQQASWLAESVYDGAIATLGTESAKAKETIETQLGMLDELFAKVQKTLLNFNQEPMQASVDPAVADPKTLPPFDELHEDAVISHKAMASLGLPSFFTGVLPFLALIVFVGAAAGGAYFYTAKPEPDWMIVGIAGGVTFVLVVALGVLLKKKSQRQLSAAMAQVDLAIRKARQGAQESFRQKMHEIEERRVAAENTRKSEVEKARTELQPFRTQSAKKREAALFAADAELQKHNARLAQVLEQAKNEAEILNRKSARDFEHRVEKQQKITGEKREMRLADAKFTYEQDRKALEQKLQKGLLAAQAPVKAGEQIVSADWNDPSWNSWTPPKSFTSAIRFGTLGVDLKSIAASAAEGQPLTIQLPERFGMPATLQFPNQGSLLIQTDRTGREEGMRTLQMVMTRILTGLPAGRARFTIFDPVGLGQNFAGFMRLADYDENLVGARIWTESDQITQRLANLSEHMETVIQKYLRNEFATIDDYNAQAGELAEPYRFLVIADFPQGFQVETVRRLTSIVSSGARCGVYVLMLRDKRIPIPSGAHLEDIEAHCLNLIHDGKKFVWKDPIFQQFPLQLDPPPSEEMLVKLLDKVGAGAKEANRVEVSFDTISPKPEEFWSLSCADELRVPIGRMGATRLQMLRFGKGVAQHGLVAGKTGSGKSSLLNALVTNTAMWYSPDEIEFFLIDFKKGVEFKAYATSKLPHARAIAVESDREFGLSVLQRLDAELTRRGDLFRKEGVQDLPSYRKLDSARKMPRTMLIIDEFQEFFSEDDKLAQDASVLLDRLVRQGRAFGIHVLLGSQTIGGTSGLARSTIGQMAVRIALQCSEADSQMILGDNNSAARLLSRPGEAIYNDAGGLVEGNSPFQIAWLPDEKREASLESVRHRADGSGIARPEAIVFEGNQPADITRNFKLAQLIPPQNGGSAASPREWSDPKVPAAWLGEPVAIKDPTAILFRRQSGANAMIIGQQDEPAMALMCAIYAGLAAQHSPDRARFILMDGTPADSSLSGLLQKVKDAIPHQTTEVEYRSVPESIAELHAELVKRRDGDESTPPAIFIFIYGLQRYRALRKSEDSFSFSMDEGEKKPQPDKQLVDLLKDGPSYGIHVVTWVDTPASIERTFDRQMMREFDHRVLFQMSASDSSLLVDSPIANKLGQNRALYYSEEQGVMEKFRPYGLPTTPWLDRVQAALK